MQTKSWMNLLGSRMSRVSMQLSCVICARSLASFVCAHAGVLQSEDEESRGVNKGYSMSSLLAGRRDTFYESLLGSPFLDLKP